MILIALLQSLDAIDKDLLLWFNSLNTPFFDEFFYWVSFKFTWVPVYIFLLIWMIWKMGWRHALLVLILIIPLITISDQLASGLFKPLFERLRPCNNPEISHLIHLVRNKCGGQFGFVSSHASNFFALATLLSLILKKYHPRIALMFFPVAIIVAFSRVYLGVHYPGDVIGGAMVGIFAGVIIWYVYKFLLSKFKHPAFKQ